MKTERMPNMVEDSFHRPFRFRLNCIDYYQKEPTSLYPALNPPATSTQGNEYSKVTVPIIRIFGATDSGQKVCAHIHGAFPYLYLEYNGPLDDHEGLFHSANYSTWRKS